MELITALWVLVTLVLSAVTSWPGRVANGWYAAKMVPDARPIALGLWLCSPFLFLPYVVAGWATSRPTLLSLASRWLGAVPPVPRGEDK